MRRPEGVSDALTGNGPSLSTIVREKKQYTNEGLILNGGGALCGEFAAAIISAVTFVGTAAAAVLTPLPVAAVAAGPCGAIPTPPVLFTTPRMSEPITTGAGGRGGGRFGGWRGDVEAHGERLMWLAGRRSAGGAFRGTVSGLAT